MKTESLKLLDDAIVEHIRTKPGHPTSSAVLHMMAVEALSPSIAARALIERRMTGLRKAGRLDFTRGGGGKLTIWRVKD